MKLVLPKFFQVNNQVKYDLSFFLLPIEAASSTTIPDASTPKHGLSKHPSSWSVDEVIQYMKTKDPQMPAPITDLFRIHVMYLLTQLSCQMSSSVRVIF